LRAYTSQYTGASFQLPHRVVPHLNKKKNLNVSMKRFEKFEKESNSAIAEI